MLFIVHIKCICGNSGFPVKNLISIITFLYIYQSYHNFNKAARNLNFFQQGKSIFAKMGGIKGNRYTATRYPMVTNSIWLWMAFTEEVAVPSCAPILYSWPKCEIIPTREIHFRYFLQKGARENDSKSNKRVQTWFDLL